MMTTTKSAPRRNRRPYRPFGHGLTLAELVQRQEAAVEAGDLDRALDYSMAIQGRQEVL